MKKLIILLSVTAWTLSASGQDLKLRFNNDGRFKIVQFTDIHYCTQNETTRAEARNSLAVLDAVLRIEKPDFVVFTGDIVTCNPVERSWDELLAVVIEHRVPYAVTLGNHDDDPEWSRQQLADYLERKPYSLFRRGMSDNRSVGNFFLQVEGNDCRTAARLLFMDSNANNSINGEKGYDWFTFDQVDWYRRTSRALAEESGGKPLPALAFFHIPLSEYERMFDTLRNNYFYYESRKPPIVVGERREHECPGILNTGMFAAMVESGDVLATFVGHDHFNNYIGRIEGICLAYGCFSGSHAKYTGARIIEMKENLRSFDTWIRRVHKGSPPESVGDSVEYRVTCPDTFLSRK